MSLSHRQGVKCAFLFVRSVSTLSSDEHESMGGAHSQVEAYIASPTSPLCQYDSAHWCF